MKIIKVMKTMRCSDCSEAFVGIGGRVAALIRTPGGHSRQVYCEQTDCYCLQERSNHDGRDDTMKCD